MLNKRLADREFIAGDYSIADIACYPWVLPERQSQDIDEFPHLKRWKEAIKARPATVRAYALAQGDQPEAGRRPHRGRKEGPVRTDQGRRALKSEPRRVDPRYGVSSALQSSLGMRATMRNPPRAQRLDDRGFAFGEVRRAGDRAKRIAVAGDRELGAGRGRSSTAICAARHSGRRVVLAGPPRTAGVDASRARRSTERSRACGKTGSPAPRRPECAAAIAAPIARASARPCRSGCAVARSPRSRSSDRRSGRNRSTCGENRRIVRRRAARRGALGRPARRLGASAAAGTSPRHSRPQSSGAASHSLRARPNRGSRARAPTAAAGRAAYGGASVDRSQSRPYRCRHSSRDRRRTRCRRRAPARRSRGCAAKSCSRRSSRCVGTTLESALKMLSTRPG